MKRFMIALLVLIFSSPVAMAQDKTLKVGLLATLEGAFTVLGEDSRRGFELALREADYKVAGRKIEVVVGPTDASPESALRAARKLVEQDKVDVIIGPLSGSEGLAMRDYSKTVPQVTFINGSSAAQGTTLDNPSENFFRFTTDGAQWTTGLGRYAYEEKGWKSVASIAEDYSFPYTQFLGFALEYCRAGGDIVDRHWVPIGNKDFSSIIAALPDDVDAIFVALGGADAVNFLNQYLQAGGDAKLIGGSITVDQSVLSATGSARNLLIGTPSAGPQADAWQDRNWQAFIKRYQDAWPADQRFPSPSLFATSYYNATNAMLQALEKVNGDLGNNQAAFRKALAGLTLNAPNGKIRLDKNRQAIGSNFITEVVVENGALVNKLVRKVDNIEQNLGLSRSELARLGPPSREVVDCASWR